MRTPDGEPVNITVYLLPMMPVWERPDLLRSGSTHLQGDFVMRGIPPGEYYLSSDNYLDAGRASPLIRVTDGTTQRFEMTLGPGRSLLLRNSR